MVVDTSALMAVVLDEAEAAACRSRLAQAPRILISAVTLMEALVVAERRGVSSVLTKLLNASAPEVASVTEEAARSAATAYARWGKGVHPARLNLADCFAYALARERGSPLLYVGSDFAQTDVASALPGAADA